MYWFLLAMLFALFGALTMLVNQKFRLDGHLISGLRGLGVGLLYMPAIFFVEIPTKPLFWGLLFLQIFLSTFFNARLYESAGKYGANSTSLISVLAVAFGMIFWWIWDWKRFFELCTHPAILIALIISLLAVAFGFYKMTLRDDMIHKGELKYMMPAVIVLAFMMMNRKWIMDDAEFFSAEVYYSAVAIFISGFANLGIYAHLNGGISGSGIHLLFSMLSLKRVIAGGLLMSIASGITIFCGNGASHLVPNPAYVNAVTLTSPLWIIGINRLQGFKIKVPIIPTLIMLGGLALLIFAASAPIHTSPYDK